MLGEVNAVNVNPPPGEKTPGKSRRATIGGEGDELDMEDAGRGAQSSMPARSFVAFHTRCP